MDFKKKFRLLYWKMPTQLRIFIYSIYSKTMKLLSPIIILKIRKGKFWNKTINKIVDINDALKFAFSFQYLAFTIRTAQIKYEITKLLEILNNLNPKIIVEIGTAGGNAFSFHTNSPS